MSRAIHFNTADRDEGVNNANCIFYRTDFRSFRNQDLTLIDMNVPITFYPISVYRHNYRLYLQEDGVTATTFVATLTTNTNYTGLTLATEVASALNGSGTGKTYTATYDLDTNRLTVTTSAGTFRLVDGTESAHEEVGYDVSDSAFYGTSFNFPYPIDVSGTKYIDVLTNVGSGSSWNSTGTYNITARVTNIASFGEILQHSFNFPLRMRMTQSSDRISFQLRDDRGYIIELGPNSHASFTFLLTPNEQASTAFEGANFMSAGQ